MRRIGLLWMLVAVCAAGAAGQDATLPDKDQVAKLEVTGRGVQIYECKLTDGKAAWTFVAPEAKLFDASGAEVGSHGAGPVWKLTDGSEVHGKVRMQQASPVSGAVPWLLLDAVDARGPIALSGVTLIRRWQTQGGKARVDGCDAAHVGERDRVEYSATYTFYGPKPH